MIDILIPTLGRPERIAAIVENVAATTRTDHRLWFVHEAYDTATQDALGGVVGLPGDRAFGLINIRASNYSGAINTAYRATDGDVLFAGSDDLRFHDGWDVEAMRLLDGWAGVIGTNDLNNPYVLQGSHATHYLVTRWYLDTIGGVVDQGPGSFLDEGYSHQYTDTEFIGTAKMRARFRPCMTSIVEHLHWSCGKGARDDTAIKAYAGEAADSERYDARRDLWFGISR